MELLLLRNRFYPTHTIGQLYIDGTYFCFVLEDVVREVPGVPVEKWKIRDETAIPQGRYEVVLQNSPKFGPDTPTLLNVPGYEGIRIHSGNTEQNTDGCLILGYKLTDQGMILFGTTKPAVADLKQKFKETEDKVYITIKTIK